MTRRTIVAVGLVAALAGCGSGGQRAAGGSASPSPSAARLALPDVDVALREGDAPQNPVLAFGSVWVAAHHGGAVVRVDPAGAVRARIQTGGDNPGGITAGEGLIWATHYGASHLLVAIDPSSDKVVRRFALPGESCCAPAVLDHTVWVAASSAVVAVDPVTGRIGNTLSDADDPIVVGHRLWVTQHGQREVVDVATGTLSPAAVPADVGVSSGDLAAGLRWGSKAGVVVGVDAAGTVRRAVPGPHGGRLFYGDAGSVVTSADNVWATDGSAKLWRIRSATAPLELAATFPADRAVSMTGDGTGGVWVSLFNVSRLVHYAG